MCGAPLAAESCSSQAWSRASARACSPWTENYRYTSFNSAHAEAMRTLYGAEIELGRSMIEYQAATVDRDQAKAYLDRALHGERVTVEVLAGDDRYARRYALIEHAPIRGENGEVLGASVVARDVTERRRIEEELRDREEQLQAVIDNSPFGMHMYRLEADDRLVFTGGNRTAEAMLGMDHSPLVGLTLEEAFPGNADTETAAAYRRVAREGGRYESHEYAYDAEGIAGVFEIHAFRFGPDRMAVFFRDVTERRKLELAVEESEKRYRSLFDNMQEGLAVCEVIYDDEHQPVDWVYLEVNPAFGRLMGLEGVVGRRVSEVIPSVLEDNPELLTIYGGVAAGGKPVEFQEYVRPLGLWLQISAFRPSPDHFVAVFENITERKRSEAELAERDRALTTLIGNLPGMAYRCRPDEAWTDEFVSAGSEALTGYTVDEYMSGPAHSSIGLMHPDDIDMIRRETDAAIARDEPWTCTYRLRTADDQIKWVWERGVAVRDEQGEVQALEGFIQDVTIEHEAEQRLSAAAQEWRATFDAMSESVALLDAEGTVMRSNAATAELTGWQLGDMPGHHCYEIFHHGDGFVAGCPHRRAMTSGRTETSVLQQDGRWYRVAVQPMVDGEGRVSGGVHIVSDITDLKNTEQQLRDSVVKLQSITDGVIATIARVVEVRDPYTAGHERRVSRLAEAIARVMGLDEDRVEGVRVAGMVHDVGKIEIPAEILSKPGRLSPMEFQLIRRHAEAGHDVLAEIEFPWPVAEIARQHHERLDGSGYPQGLTGEETLLEARIVAVADVVEAMASHRPYRPALGIEAALKEIGLNRGRLYDEAASDACIELFNSGAFAFDEDATP